MNIVYGLWRKPEPLANQVQNTEGTPPNEADLEAASSAAASFLVEEDMAKKTKNADSQEAGSIAGSAVSNLIEEGEVQPMIYRTYGAIQNVVKREPRSICEAAHYIAHVASGCLSTISYPLEHFIGVAGSATNLLYGAELFISVPKAVDSCSIAWKGSESTTVVASQKEEAVLPAAPQKARDFTPALTAIRHVGRSFNGVVHVLEGASAFVPFIRHWFVVTLQKANVFVTGAWSGISLRQAVQNLSKADSDEKKVYNWLKIAENVSFLAAAVISASGMIFKVAVATTVPAAFMALGLTLTVVSAYYGMRTDPYKLNQDKMLNARQMMLNEDYLAV